MVGLPETVKPRKRQAAKPASTQKVKLTLYVSVETAQRLAVHAAMNRVDKSSLAESLLSAGCRRYVIQDRGGRVAEPVAIPGTGDIGEAEAAA